MRIHPIKDQVPGCQEDSMDHAQETIIMFAPGPQRKGQEVNISQSLIVATRQEQEKG